jgi:hypothetical protein
MGGTSNTHGIDEKCIQTSSRRHRWENTIKVNLKETECEDVILIYLVQDRVLWSYLISTVMNLWVPYKTGNFLTT